MMNIAFRHMTGAAASAALTEEYVELYLRTRAEPPYSSGPLYSRERFIERTAAQVKSDGFELVAAEDGKTLVGFAFGFTMEPGRWWLGAANPPRKNWP